MSNVASAMSLSDPTRATSAHSLASLARDCVRLTITISAAPRSPSAATTARAVPPAPSTTARLPSMLAPPRTSASQQPSPSVFAPRNAPVSPKTMVFTDPERCAISSRFCTSANAASL